MYFKEFDNKIRAIANLVLHGLLVIYIVANVASFVSKADTWFVSDAVFDIVHIERYANKIIIGWWV